MHHNVQGKQNTNCHSQREIAIQKETSQCLIFEISAVGITYHITFSFLKHVCLKCISNLNKHFLNETNFWEISSGKFLPESGKIQFTVSVKPEPEQEFELLVLD